MNNKILQGKVNKLSQTTKNDNGWNNNENENNDAWGNSYENNKINIKSDNDNKISGFDSWNETNNENNNNNDPWNTTKNNENKQILNKALSKTDDVLDNKSNLERRITGLATYCVPKKNLFRPPPKKTVSSNY